MGYEWWEVTGKDQEEEAATALTRCKTTAAAAAEVSMDATVAAGLTDLDGIFTLKKKNTVKSYRGSDAQQTDPPSNTSDWSFKFAFKKLPVGSPSDGDVG